MRINYNVSAAIANKNLLGIEDNLSTSMERLSSGLKINHAKDNPAGMAISNKMQAQIDGLSRASQNSSDGVSVIQIADGALNETTSILQRMRELSVQAASDATMSDQDKKAIQDEISSLKEEINRISTDTEYNTKALLDGTLDTRVYAGNVSRISISDYVNPGNYELTIDQAATQAGPIEATADFTDTAATVGQSGIMSINGSEVEIEATDTYAEAFEKIRQAAEKGETTASLDTATGAASFTADAYGHNSVLELTFDNDDLAAALGFDGTALEYDTTNKVYTYKEAGEIPTGTDAKVTLTKSGDGTGFGDTATVSADGNKVTVSDKDGFSLSFLAKTGFQADPTATPATDGKVEFDVTDIGTMVLHIGANMDQNMSVRIEEVSCDSLYIDDLDVTTVNGADRALVQLDGAIAKVSSVRSKLGAYENRLDYTTDSLDAFGENMTSAISRLTDADMAAEMTDYTHKNVLNQAAISVLTQANDLPQQVLQILQ